MLARLIAREVDEGLKAGIRPALRYLRGVAFGLVWLALATVAGTVTLVALGIALYLKLIAMLGVITAALIVGGIALVLTILGVSLANFHLHVPRD